MSDLRVIVLESEIPGVLVGQALEKDLCVQGDTVEQIVHLMGHQLDYHTGRSMIMEEGDTEYHSSERNIEDIEAAPQYLQDRWDDASIHSRLTLSYE